MYAAVSHHQDFLDSSQPTTQRKIAERSSGLRSRGPKKLRPSVPEGDGAQ
jgi:hypothetical protein